MQAVCGDDLGHRFNRERQLRIHHAYFGSYRRNHHAGVIDIRGHDDI